MTLLKLYKLTNILTKAMFAGALPPFSCRFTPSCSQYAKEVVHKYGPLKGGLLAAYRLLRCHPLSRGGFDPVK